MIRQRIISRSLFDFQHGNCGIAAMICSRFANMPRYRRFLLALDSLRKSKPRRRSHGVLIARAAPGAVNAIDPSEGQLSFARRRPGARLAQFRIGDAQALPFADNSFDAAAMALAAMFVPYPAKVALYLPRSSMRISASI